jgi:hypothetical protein
VGRWDGAVVSAAIRRGTAKPDYLVIDLVTGMEGYSGAVTLYGKPSGTTVMIGESYDPADPTASACRVALSRGGNALEAEEIGPCPLPRRRLRLRRRHDARRMTRMRLSHL